MDTIPEMILLPLSKPEAILILDSLSEHHLLLRERGEPDQQAEMYDHVITKIVALLNETGEARPQLVV